MVDIQAGEGGDDSKLFVDDLVEMYLRFAARNGCQPDILYSERGKASLRIDGPRAPALFANESGKHVVQRVPPTERNGRRHTSMVCVSVLPVAREAEFTLRDSDIDVETKRGSGPGGQHRNKTESCVRMRHRPTGVTATVDSRDQHSNRREARRVLESRVREMHAAQASGAASEAKRAQMGGGTRGDKIRTYNFIESRVADHRLGTKTTQIEKVMKGQLELILSS